MYRDIKGFENLYSINEHGQVKSHITGRILRPGIRSGYLFVVLCKDGKHYKKNVHRLMADTFIPNPDNLPVVMHLDNDKTNCELYNLKRGTYQENTIQAHEDGLCAKTKQIYQVYNDTDYQQFDGCDQVIEAIGYSNHRSVITTKVRNESRIKSGPYKGYRIRKMIKPFKINVQRSTLDEGGIMP